MDVLALAREVGGQAAISILLVVALTQAIRMILRRSEKDAEVVRRALEREQARVDEQREQLDEWQEDITENTAERLMLTAQLEEKKLALVHCQEMLARSGIGGLPAAEERALREMIIRLKADNKQLNEKLKSKEGDP